MNEDDTRITPPDDESDQTLHIGGSGKVPIAKTPLDAEPVSSAYETLQELDTAPTISEPPPVPHLSTRLTTKEGVDRYQITREFARGGMGRILLAYDSSIGRQIALKETLRAAHSSGSTSPRSDSQRSADEVSIERFLREAKVTGRLEHPNIVPVYEIGERADGRAYYTMRFVPGETMADKLRTIRNDAVLTEDERFAKRIALLDSFVDICNAIAYAHSHGVIHRDLKPQNVIIGEFGETVLIDWGLARVEGQSDHHADAMQASFSSMSAADSSLTLEGTIIGTPAYMPPEQAEGRIADVDERSDVYALGAILYEILGGEAPFRGPNGWAVLQAVLEGPPLPLKAHYANVPPELNHLVERAMARDAKDRIASASALADEVRAFRDGRTLASYSYSGREHLLRFLRKYKAVVATVVIALIILAVLGTMAYLNVSNERNNALEAKNAAQSSEARALESKAAALASEKVTEGALERAKESEEAARLALGQSEIDRGAAELALSTSKQSLREAQETRSRAHLRESQAAVKRYAYQDALLQRAAAIAASPDEQESRTALAGLAMLSPTLLWQSTIPELSGFYEPMVLDPSGRFFTAVSNQRLVIVDGVADKIVASFELEGTSPAKIVWRPDGKSLLVLGYSGGLWKIDLMAAAAEALTQLGSVGMSSEATFSRDGSVLATLSSGKRLSLFATDDGCKSLGRIELADESDAGMALSDDGRQIAFFQGRRSLCVAEISKLEAHREVMAFESEVYGIMMTFSPEAKALALLDYDQDLYVIDLATGKSRKSAGSFTGSLHWQSESRLCVLSGNQVTNYDLPQDDAITPQAALTFDGIDMPLDQRLSADGSTWSTLIYHYEDTPHLRLFDAASGKPLSGPRPTPATSIVDLVLSPDDRLAACLFLNTLTIYDRSSGAKRLLELGEEGLGYFGPMAFTWDGGHLWLTSTTMLLRINTESLRYEKFPLPEEQESSVMALSPDQRTLVMAATSWNTSKLSLAVFDSETATWRRNQEIILGGSISQIRFDRDGHGFKLLSHDGKVRWINLATLMALPTTWQIPGGARLAGNDDCYLHLGSAGAVHLGSIFDGENGNLRTIATGFAGATSITYSGDLRVAGLWNYVGEVLLVDLVSGRPLGRFDLREDNQQSGDRLYHVNDDWSSSGVSTLALDQAGLTMLAASEQGTLRAFDLSHLPSTRALHLSAATPTIAALLASQRQERGQKDLPVLPEIGDAYWGPWQDTVLVAPEFYSWQNEKLRTFDLVSLSQGRHLARLLDVSGKTIRGVLHSADRQEFVVLAMRYQSFEDENKPMVSAYRVNFLSDGSFKVSETSFQEENLRQPQLLPDGRILFLASGGKLNLMDRAGKITTLLELDAAQVDSGDLTLAPKGKRFVITLEERALVYELDGAKLLRAFEGVPAYSSVLLNADGTLLVSFDSNALRARRVSDGTEAWRSSERMSLETIHRLDESSGLVSSGENTFLKVNLEDGRELGRYAIPVLHEYLNFDVSLRDGRLLYAYDGGLLIHDLEFQGEISNALNAMAPDQLVGWAEAKGGRELDGFATSTLTKRHATPLEVEPEVVLKAFGANPSWLMLHAQPRGAELPNTSTDLLQRCHESALSAFTILQRARRDAFEGFRVITSVFGGTTRSEPVAPREFDPLHGTRKGEPEGIVDHGLWWQRTQHDPAALANAEILRARADELAANGESALIAWRWLVELTPQEPSARAAVAAALLEEMTPARTLDERAALFSEIEGHVSAGLEITQDASAKANLLIAKADAAGRALLEEASLAAYREAIRLYASMDQDTALGVLGEAVQMLISFARPDLARQEVLAHSALMSDERRQEILAVLTDFEKSFAALSAAGLRLPRLLVDRVEHLSAAAKGGVVSGDIVVTLAGLSVQEHRDLGGQWQAIFGDAEEAGPESVELVVMRAGLLVALQLPSAADHGIGALSITSRQVAQRLALRSQADASFTRADAIPTDNPERQKSFAKVVENYTTLLALEESPWGFMRRGIAHYWLSGFEATIADLTRALDLNGSGNSIDPGLALAYRGYAHGSLLNHEAALRDLLSAIEGGSRAGYIYHGALMYAYAGGFYSKGVEIIELYGAEEWTSPPAGLADLVAGLPVLKKAQSQLTSFPALVVFTLQAESPEAAAGMEIGDCLLRIADKPIQSISDFSDAWRAVNEAGTQEVEVVVLRAGQEVKLTYATPTQHGFNAYICAQETPWPKEGE